MKINITKKEYACLLDMLGLADWVMHSHTVSDDERHQEHEALIRKIYAYASSMDAEDKIEYSKRFDDYFERDDYMEDLHEKFIDPFEEATFWDELIDRLGKQDAILQHGADKLQKMEPMERITKIEDAKEKYTDEFEKHGTKHLKINKN
tara:strand:- start:202 stop:648 length:447 start_codon:yes stop_codon:yes gene_type:complete